ncbi:hypothetical protein BRC91_07660 [Halobacteriales archaeon QS_4_62_28]|nr:MAG: hypothetical protein BRC91_07660 [Halobacteriales archaeon QS_4_62_28]
MTSIDTHCTTASAETSPLERSRRKSVLFCPGCGYESGIDGEWVVRRDSETRTYVCPQCETEIASH